MKLFSSKPPFIPVIQMICQQITAFSKEEANHLANKYAREYNKQASPKPYLSACIIFIELAFLIGISIRLYYQSNIKSSGIISYFMKSIQSNQADSNTDFIKWVDFQVTSEAMNDAYQYDIQSHDTDTKIDWINLLAVLGVKYGGDFKNYKKADMDTIAQQLIKKETTLEEMTKNMKYYNYYNEAYHAVLGGMVGEYKIPSENDGTKADSKSASTYHTVYGLKAFSPIAKGFPYSDYDDFGTSRSFGFRRQHLGHDMMGQIGTPIIAVESGYIECLGWNRYGGWRIGIRSFDKKRYYYYAHLRQNFPYCKSLAVGSVVTAGDVIGYMGHTGYSDKENVNNIDVIHLHFGMQLIFDESQKDGNGEIWISCYELARFLSQNRSEVTKEESTKEWHRTQPMIDPAAEAYRNNQKRTAT